jgi:hypothetical protein
MSFLKRTLLTASIFVLLSLVAPMTCVRGNPGAHIAVTNSPVPVGQQVRITFSIDAGDSGDRANVWIDQNGPALWESGVMTIVAGMRYEVVAPGISTPGSYAARVQISRSSGGGYDAAMILFQVVAAPGGGGACFTASLSSSTISAGTSSITVRGTDTCDLPSTGISVAVFAAGVCTLGIRAGRDFPIADTYRTSTDASSAYSLSLPTSTLSPGSYCVGAWTGSLGAGQASLNPLTVTSGSSPPPSGAGFDFSLGLSPSSLSVAPGGTANYQILITYSSPSYAGTTITLQGVTGLGAGMNYQVIPSPAGLIIFTSQSTPAGSYTIMLVGSATGVTHQASAVLIVQPAQQQFDFSILVSPSQQTVAPGGSANYAVTVSLVSGDPNRAAVELSVSGAPAGVSASFNPLYGTATFTSTMSVKVDSSVASGRVTLTVTGKWWIAQTGETRTHTAPATLIVTQAPDFRVEAGPPLQTVSQGQTVSYSVRVVGLNGFNSQVFLSVGGLPPGANGVFSIPSASPDYSSTLTLTIPNSAAAGSFTLTITGTGGGISKIANVILIVTPTIQTQATAQTTAQTQSSQPTTQTGSGDGDGSTAPNGLLNYLQQNSLLVIALLGTVIVLLGVLALRGRKPSYTPSSYPQLQPSSFTCRGCGTLNPAGNDFCANCGERLR